MFKRRDYNYIQKQAREVDVLLLKLFREECGSQMEILLRRITLPPEEKYGYRGYKGKLPKAPSEDTEGPEAPTISNLI